MMYNFVYEPEYFRIIPAILIDARASIPEIKNQTGFPIKYYTDAQVAQINERSITYKIETEIGVLAGFFSIQVNTINKTAILLMKQFRPAFMQFNTDLSLQIGNFISNNEFQPDYLF